MNQVYQKGYNRKGLLSEKGEKKKAWYIMHDYYKKKYYAGLSHSFNNDTPQDIRYARK